MLGAVCTRLLSIAAAFARFAVVAGSGDSSALGREKRGFLKGSHDVHVLGSVRRVVMAGFPRHAEESGKWKTWADDTAAECGDDLLRPRAGLGYPGTHDGILVGVLRTQRLLMVLVV
jgi:hypothetical protein